MKKYIDIEKLIAEIERYENTAIDAYNPRGEDADFWHGKVVACEDLKTLVTSLQQEQPKVDFEKEVDACWQNWLSPSNKKEVEGVLPKTEFAMYARHFYELGLKTKK